jgi:hypothetical protein
MTDTPFPRSQRDQSITDRLFRIDDPLLRSQLEAFRIEWENRFGTTDLTRTYTSQLSREAQVEMLRDDPQRYFLGLPQFVQAFIHGKFEIAREKLRLDDMPDGYLEIYLSGFMSRVLADGGRSRPGG